MAEARSATSEPNVHVEDADFEDDQWRVNLREWRRTLLKRFFRVRNLVKNGMWPTSLWNLCVVVAMVAGVMVTDYPQLKNINDRFWGFGEYFYVSRGPSYFLPKVLIVSCLIGVIGFMVLLFIRRYLLRLLLSYRGWLYQNPKTQSIKTLIWCICVRVISGYTPTTYACQLSLPRQPVPSLDHTIERYLESVEELFSPEELEKLKKEAQEFKTTIAPKLQRLLVLKSWWVNNYITDWWEKYVYLMGRTPLTINSNYYTMDNAFWTPTKHQTSRAAGLVYMLMQFKRKIEREEVIPLLIRNTIPVCMYQYERAFATTRIPGEDFDEIMHYDSSASKHIVVLRKGIYYKLDNFDVDGTPLSPTSIEALMEWIIKDADTQQESEGARSAEALAGLTSLERTDWARKRTKYFGSGINKESLEVIESAAFVVNLETRIFEGFSERSKFLIHGDGKVIWFDKSMCIHFFPDGHYGVTAEHSWGDAPVMSHIQEYAITEEILGDLYKDGRVNNFENVKNSKVKPPCQLHWNVTDELDKIINEAVLFNVKNSEDLDMCVRRHMDFGKGVVKTCKVSPDAFIQLALQLAYYRDNKKFALTYEASMTRLYLNGRTETVRSLTKESAQFVKGMVEDNLATEEKIRLLQTAAKVHQRRYRDCMSAKGCDRHLFALYVACKGLNHESEFLHRALTLPWTLSTSQTPQQQIAGNPTIAPEHADKASPGGGFGPVSDQGYGVSYMIPEDTHFWFHVSSKVSCETTNSARFMDGIFSALGDMRKLFLE